MWKWFISVWHHLRSKARGVSNPKTCATPPKKWYTPFKLCGLSPLVYSNLLPQLKKMEITVYSIGVFLFYILYQNMWKTWYTEELKIIFLSKSVFLGVLECAWCWCGDITRRQNHTASCWNRGKHCYHYDWKVPWGSGTTHSSSSIMLKQDFSQLLQVFEWQWVIILLFTFRCL